MGQEFLWNGEFSMQNEVEWSQKAADELLGRTLQLTKSKIHVQNYILLHISRTRYDMNR